MSFNKYTNYNEHSGVSSVVFGSDTPVLEVELNEMQEIQKTTLRNFIKNVIGNGITDKSKIAYKDGVLSVASDCSFVVDGYIILCTGLSITAPDNSTVYLQVWEEDVDYTSTLKKGGNEQATETITNYIKDSRYPIETSRRKVLKYKLSLTQSQESNVHNLVVASIFTGGNYTRAIKEVNLAKLTSKTEDLQTYVGLYGEGVFGVEVDLDNNSVKRVGNNMYSTPGSDYNNLSIYGGRKRCNVTNDGVVVAFYGDTAYTETGALTVAVTGTNGVTYPVGTKVQCMVMQPKFYYKRIPIRLEKQVDANYSVIGYHLKKWVDLISPTFREGYKLHPAFKKGDTELDYYFIGENEGCVENSSGVYDLTDSMSIPASPYTGYKFSSIAGAKPASGASVAGVSPTGNKVLTRDAIRKMCANRGSGWQQLDITILSAEQMLFLIEYATFNVQSTTLGIGASKMEIVTDKNDSITSPLNNLLSNNSGVIPITHTHSKGTTYSINIPVYRGVKNPYGDCILYVDGFIRNYSSNTSNNEAYWQNGGVSFSDDVTNYNACGFSCGTSEGYIKAFGYSKDCDFMYIPSKVGGNSDNPIGDYYYVIMNSNQNYLPLFGGSWGHGSQSGLFYFSLDFTSLSRYCCVGGRLCRKAANVVFAV